MFPYDMPVFTRERLRKYKGFEEMSDEMLDKALDVLYTITWAYLNNREKIEEYEGTESKMDASELEICFLFFFSVY